MTIHTFDPSKMYIPCPKCSGSEDREPREDCEVCGGKSDTKGWHKDDAARRACGRHALALAGEARANIRPDGDDDFISLEYELRGVSGNLFSKLCDERTFLRLASLAEQLKREIRRANSDYEGDTEPLTYDDVLGTRAEIGNLLNALGGYAEDLNVLLDLAELCEDEPDEYESAFIDQSCQVSATTAEIQRLLKCTGLSDNE